MIATNIVCLALAVLTLIDPYYGLLFLMAGFCALNRDFAYIHLQIGPIPIYITELFLALAVTRTAVTKFQRRPEEAKPVSMPWWPWLGFGTVAAISTLQGLAHFSKVAVLRDAALAYYAIFTWIAKEIDWNRERLRQGGKFLLAICVLKGLAVALGPALSTQNIRMLIVGENPAAISMYFVLALLMLGLSGKTSGSALFNVVLSIPISLGLSFLLVRSAWVGYGAALLVLGIALWKMDPGLMRAWAYRQLLMAAGFVLVLGSLSSVSPSYRLRKELVLEEIMSFTQGVKSENVSTRLYFWRDALEELFSTGLYSRHLKHQDLKKYFLPENADKQDSSGITIQVGSRTHRGELLEIKFHETPVKSTPAPASSTAPTLAPKITPVATSQPSPAPKILPTTASKATNIAPAQGAQARWAKILFGIPFGKSFFPLEVISWLENTDRYDPHNSQIAILYRMGILGYFFFLAILFFVTRRLIRSICNHAIPLQTRVMTAGLLSVIVYHQVHSLTDVTMENAFKGAVLWIALGLALSHYEDLHRA